MPPWALLLLATLGLTACTGLPPAGGLEKPREWITPEVRTDTLRIREVDFGVPRRGTNRFTALLENRTRKGVTVGLDLRADPGLWLRKWQSQWLFYVHPGEEAPIDVPYEFLKMSPEATLRIRFAFPDVMENGATTLRPPFFERRYDVGRAIPPTENDLRAFDRRDTQHFTIYYMRGTLAAKEMDAIAEEREMGFRKISELVGASDPGRIRLVLFPDGPTKTAATGHTGHGWAYGNNMIEVYNEEIRLDPFHELTHILMRELGDPPAMFNEGFAVYLAERFGADALAGLGSPGKTVDQVAARDHEAGRLFPLAELFAFTEIGSRPSRPGISYPQAASFAKFLIEEFGLGAFLDAYRAMGGDGEPDTIRRNEVILEKTFGEKLGALESAWLAKLGTVLDAGRTSQTTTRVSSQLPMRVGSGFVLRR